MGNEVSSLRLPDGNGGHLRVILIDPARLTRDSLAHLLHDRAPDFQIASFADSSEAAARHHEVPAIVLVNTKMSAQADPVVKAGTARLTELWPDVPRLLISERNDGLPAALAAINEGWQGFFSATLGVELLVAAIRLIIMGGIFIPPDIARECAIRLQSNHRVGL